MGNNPKISVIIVSYNFERYLSQCIESVYNQSLKPCEILICDDASTDGSWNIIESYRARYPDLIRTIRQITNTGPYQNWKSAYQMVRGELLSVIDGDDYWHPDKLLREWQALQNNPRARAAWSSVILYHEENGRSEEWIPEENVTETNDLFVQVYAKRFFKGKRSLFRNELVYKDAFDNVGFNASIPVHLDWDMKIRLTFRYPVVWSGARTVYYRLHDSGIHKTRHDKMYASARQVAMKNMALLRNRPKTDTDYVLDNVNALLRQLSGQGGHKHEDLTQRDVFPGPLLVNSLPKAGTNLLTKALRMMPGITETSLHFGNSTQNTSGQKGATLPIGVDMPKPYSLEAFRRQLNALPEHSFLSAHIPYTETAARVLREQGIPILLMLRDPADVAFSHATYVTKTPGHPLLAYYQTLSEDARILFSITGGRANDVTLLSLEERLRSIVRWMDEPNVTVIRFEELVGARGGGDDAAQRETLKKIARTIGVDADDSVLNDIQHQLFGGTGTFNKGVRGAARQRFTREHRRAYARIDSTLLNQLGYPMSTMNSTVNTTASEWRGENLIFLVSQPRAGSTMLQRVLAGHSRIHTLAEPWVMLPPLFALKNEGMDAAFSMPDARIGRDDFINALPGGREDYLAGFRAMAREWYNRALQNSGKDIFLDKTPRYYHILPELRETVPAAQTVLLFRNPLAVLASILDTWVKKDWNRLALHRHDLFAAPRRLIQEAAQPGAIRVAYENLARAPESTLKTLCDALGLAYEPDMIRYGNRQAPRGSMGDPVGVGQHERPSEHSVNKWRLTLRDPMYKLLGEIYLTALGAQTVAAMGYDFQSLLAELRSIESPPLTVSEPELDACFQALKINRHASDGLNAVIEQYRKPAHPDVYAVTSDRGLPRNTPVSSYEYLVSAIVSTYNSERFIEGCLQSLVNQTLYRQGRLEIIVIDAHSPQKEGDIVRAFQDKYDHIRYVRTDKREGIYASWNRGIAMARGKYITNANTDDRLRADGIEKLAALLEAHPDKVLAYGNSRVTTVPNETFETNSLDGTQYLIWPDFDRRTMHSWCYIGPHPVWRKSLHDELGMFDESLTSAADWDFWLRAALKNDFIHLDEFVGLYYLSDETVSRRGDIPIIEAQRLRKKYKAAYKAVAGPYIIPESLPRPEENTLLVILHNFPPFWFGGTENYVINWVRGLQQKGFSVHVLFPHADADQAAPEIRPKTFQGIQTLQVWYDPAEYNYYLDNGGEVVLRMLDDWLKRNPYKHAHYHHIQGLPLQFAHILNAHDIPYTVTLHDFTLICLRNHLFHYQENRICDRPSEENCASCFFHLFNINAEVNLKNQVKSVLAARERKARSLLAGAAFITAPSSFVKNRFVKYGWVKDTRITVQPLGMETMHPLPKTSRTNQTVFAFLGNINHLKNPLVLLHAFEKTKGDVRLEIWGNGKPQELSEVHAFCQKEKRAQYMGAYNPSQMPEILSRVDVVVVPSFMESYSMVVREALLLNTPVVAAAVGGILDVIKDGANGWLFDPTDVQTLQNILQDLVDHPEKIQQAQQSSSEIVTYEQDLNFWSDYYEKALLQPGTGISNSQWKNKSNRPAAPRVLVLSVESENRACPYIRLRTPLQLLEREGYIDYHIVHPNNVEILEKIISETDIVIAQRNLPGHLPFSKLRNILRNNKIRLVYEFDDAFWTLPSNHLAYNFYQQMMPELKNYIKSADLVTVSTDYMARYVAKLNKNVRVLENALDDALWTFREPRSAQDKIRLLFSGTPTHHDDLKIVVKPLLKILNEYGDRVEVILWGNEIEELMALPQVQRGPDFTPDYTLYARQLQSLDVDLAIVPLADTPFNRAKSHIKWLEYSACGITGIYSRVGAYPKHIKDKQTGLLVNNSHKAWYRALKWMLEHPEERLKMAIQAQEDIKKQHTISSATSRWYEAYATLVSLPEIPKIQSPVVSIIILAWNKWTFTEKCLKALQHNTTGIAYEVIVVDNGSDDQTWKNLQEWKASYPQLRPMRNETNLGFSVGNNRALKEARGPWVVFLNNDTEPRPHWLDAMLAIAQNDPSVGAVGAKLVYPDETIQHAGVAIVDDRKNGDPLLAQHILHGRPKDFPQANLMIEFQAVTAACMLMPRQLAIKLNGFDEGYQNGYEDVDLCFRIREAGYKVVYQPHAELVHHESKSGPERFAHVAENIQRLHKRWMGKIRHDFRLEPNGEAIQLNGPITLYTPPGQTAETPKDDRPGVSIIMLTFNALEMTRQTITSVLEHTRYPYELIVVDNASGADTVAYLKELEQQHPHIKVLFNKENKGFSAGNNQGVAASDGHYVCLLNNDVLVGDGWLEDLVEAFDRDAQIGMVSAITNKASGLQVLASVPYKDETGFYKFAKEWRQEHRGQVTPRRRLAGFVMLTSRAIYDEIGGFDEIYGLGNFEDDDISLKIRQAGYALMVHDGTFIHHYGHSSFKANNIDLMASLKENEKIFNQKWPDVDYDELLEIKNPLHEVHPRKIEQATRALNDGDARQAFELYREVVDENPLSGEGLMGLAFAAFFLGELEEAEHALLRARLHFPEHAVVRNQLGMLYAHKGNWEQAVQYFQQAAERDAHYAEARHNLCQALIESGAYEKGLTVLTEWLNTHPEDVTGMMMMARYNLEVGRTDEARLYLERVLEIDPRNDEARQLLQQQTTASTEEQQATEMLEQAYELLNNFDEQNAEALFHKSGALHPAPEALFGEVLCALRKDQQLRAVTLLNKITDRWPDFAPACNQLGIIHFQDGRVEEALAWFARAIENDRDWLEPQRNYGLALIEKGDYENGIATFNKIIGQHPDDVESLLIIAGFYIEVERWNQAENMLQKILEIDPENETARRQLTEIKAHLEMPAP